MLQVVSEPFQWNRPQQVVGECKGQKLPGFLGADPSRAQIENGLGRELTGRRSVGTFNVVGVNLQLRFGIHLGMPGKQEVPVLLLGIGSLRILRNDDPPLETPLVNDHP